MDIRETYLAAWNETEREARRGILAAHYDEAATYVDPHADVEGVEAISAVDRHGP